MDVYDTLKLIAGTSWNDSPFKWITPAAMADVIFDINIALKPHTCFRYSFKNAGLSVVSVADDDALARQVFEAQ
jgi:hypothetical protein